MYKLNEFFLIYNIIITCSKLKEMRLLIFLLFFKNFFNPENNKFYSINKELSSTGFFWSYEQKTTTKIIYKDGFLNIEGLSGNANLTIYTIIGNKVVFFPNIDITRFKESVSLQRETMYIARIEFSNAILTYKFFTR